MDNYDNKFSNFLSLPKCPEEEENNWIENNEFITDRKDSH